MSRHTQRVHVSCAMVICALANSPLFAQTTAGTSTTIVFPVSAQTVSFASEMTLFNPGPNLLTAAVRFYEANNSGAPGPKVCNDVNVPAGRSVQITLATQCALTGSANSCTSKTARQADTPRPSSSTFTRTAS